MPVCTVCHIITKLELGGAQEVALFTVAHLDPARFKAVLIAGPGGLLTDEAKALAADEVRIIPALAPPIRPFQDFKAFIQLARLLRRIRPAIVHTHSSKAGIVGRWAAWVARVPIIVHTIHGYGITPQQGTWLRGVLIGLEYVTGFITTQWVAVSQADITRGRHWGIFHNAAVTLVRPGIDPCRFQAPLLPADREGLRAKLGAGPEHLLVGTVTCLKPQKAPEDFISVAMRVCAQVPSARFVLIGDGELREAVEAQIRDANLAERIRLVGWRRDVPEIMQALDLFLLTSHWEGLPRVLLEARFSGVPLIATRVGGAAEAILEGRHGWLCEPGDVKSLADRVCDGLANLSRKERSRSSGDLPEEFDIRTMLRQYEQLYDTLLLDNGVKLRAVSSVMIADRERDESL